jgi:hypothetical protein
MANIRIPRLVGKPNKAGIVNWYWQPSKTVRAQGWEQVDLGRSPGADPPDAIVAACRARNAAYQAWRNGGALPVQVPRPAPILTVGQGIAAFKAERYPSVKKPGETVAPATARQYKSKLKVLDRWAGDVALRSIDADRVAVLKDALMRPAAAGQRKGEVRHHHAHETLRVGRTLFTWFEQKRWIPKGANPFEDFALAAPAPRDQIWQAPAREAILAAADAAALPNMALAVDLAFSIGQREADLLRIGLRQYAEIPGYKMDPDVFETLSRVPVPAYGGRPGYLPGNVWGIRVRQAKTKRWVEVPIVGLTRARVEAAIEEAKALGLVTLLRDERTGLPWTMPNLATGQEYFIRRFAELRAAAIAATRAEADDALAAEIQDLQFRDFRRTAVVYQGELGIAVHLIVAVTGHDLDEGQKILDTYLPRTTGMAARAIALSQARAPAAAEREKQA